MLRIKSGPTMPSCLFGSFVFLCFWWKEKRQKHLVLNLFFWPMLENVCIVLHCFELPILPYILLNITYYYHPFESLFFHCFQPTGSLLIHVTWGIINRSAHSSTIYAYLQYTISRFLCNENCYLILKPNKRLKESPECKRTWRACLYSRNVIIERSHGTEYTWKGKH